MEGKKNPVLMLAVAFLVLIAGSLLALLHVGMSARTAKAIHYDFNFRGATLAASTYIDDVERGAGIAKAKAADIYEDYFGGSPAGEMTASADQPRTGEENSGEGGEVEGEYTPESDAFEKYYEKHYGKDADSPSLGFNDGGGSFAPGGGGESGTFQANPENAPAKKAARGKDGAKPEPGEGGKQTAQGGPGGIPFGQSGSSSPSSQAAKTFASLPGKKAPPPLFPEQGPSAGGPAAGKDAKGGGLSGFQNRSGAAQLDSALERASSGAKSDYGAKMSAGAAAVAAGAAGGAGGGGSVPAASKPADASGDGKSAGSKDAAGKSDKSGDKSSDTGDYMPEGGGDTGSGGAIMKSAVGPAAGGSASPMRPSDPDLVKSVVTERLNGAEVGYLTADDDAAAPEEVLLKPGALADPAAEKAPEDPEEYLKLPEPRKLELRKEMHSFMKRVENKYGKMTDIYYTSCSSTPDLCKEHELTQNYLTMITSEKAELMMGVKYVKGHWRPYTIGFTKPGGGD